MGTRQTHPLPAQLERTRQRFDSWRQTRKGRPRIPEPLWASAVKAADKYGLYRTARALGLDYNMLKKRVKTASSPEEEAVATFVELTSPGSVNTRECLLELENPVGAKMRVHLKGIEAPDLLALSRNFWGIEVHHGESRRGRR